MTTAGTRLLRIPFNAADPFNYYTVEVQRKDNWWASGLPATSLLVHEVKPDGRITLVDGIRLTRPLAAGAVFAGNGVTITLNSAVADRASITVTGGISRAAAGAVMGPNACSPGFVWREADDSDYVCVPPATRTHTRNDNAAAERRKRPDGSCIGGYVFREAFLNDLACVTPATRAQARADNASAGSRMKRPHG